MVLLSGDQKDRGVPWSAILTGYQFVPVKGWERSIFLAVAYGLDIILIFKSVAEGGGERKALEVAIPSHPTCGVQK